MGDARIYSAKNLEDNLDRKGAHRLLREIYPFKYCPFCGEKLKEVEKNGKD